MNKTIDLKVFSQRLSSLLDNTDETTYSLANKLGLTPATISRYANALMKPKVPTVISMAQIFNVNDAWLMGYDVPRDKDIVTNKQQRIKLNYPEISEDYVEFPVIGDVAAGFDKIAIEDWNGDKILIPSSYLKGRNKDNFFVLRVKGDSMYPMYIDGDKVLVLKQNATDYNGQVAVAIYNDDNGTIKKIEQRKNAVYLVPINPQYQPVEIKGTDIESLHILGVPKLLIRDLEDN